MQASGLTTRKQAAFNTARPKLFGGLRNKQQYSRTAVKERPCRSTHAIFFEACEYVRALSSATYLILADYQDILKVDAFSDISFIRRILVVPLHGDQRSTVPSQTRLSLCFQLTRRHSLGPRQTKTQED